ncbi:hypothetical protein HXX76_005172 [Chlamydomonas incerta]|uniref:Phospholipid scramblase n=1 Tax=Chlamydomonas incerta TaxID=51695 RepID=A0A835T4D3_CHLIN|nr:hypothetical protein HXX76_005172 [Chlamydomonas incerta]|eukprot:KAG2438624.1 hypothetical protein HXX76_005172 [Chlamydomonas incerta]
MHRSSLALLGRAAGLGARAIADASVGSGAAPLSALASLLAHQHVSFSAASLSSLAAAGRPGASLPLLRRGLHTSVAAALADDRSAAVRRLAAARTRRAKASDSDTAATRERAAAEEQALVAGGDAQQQQPATGLVPAHTDALTVTPVEGKASEVQLAAALDHPALIVTRPIEWGTVIFGYEQANKYTVYDESGAVVALVAEDGGGLGKEIGRQLLRTRRSFTATVFSADGSQVLFRLRRPAYLVSSTMFVEDGAGNVLGEIHQRWNLLKRNYDLYMGKSQFAAISGTFLAWEFELKDVQGGTLALVDRNFQGFAKEIFTDAGKYVIHFGYKGQQLEQQLQNQQQAQEAAAAAAAAAAAQPPQQQPAGAAGSSAPAAASGAATTATPVAPAAAGAAATAAPVTPTAATGAAAAPPPPPVTLMAQARTDVAVIPVAGGNQLVVGRPLDLPERMVALACALTIDYDYFSQHSHSGGGLVGPMMYPMPMPFPGGGGGGVPPVAAPGAEGVEGVPGAAGAGVAGGAVGEMGAGGAGADVGAGAGGWGAAEGGQPGAGGAPGSGSGSGWGDEGFDSGKGWGQPGSDAGEGEMKWDLGGDGGAADAGGGEEGGGVVGVLKTLWGIFGGGDE